MASDIPERDWKYMKLINADLLDLLCKRINKQSIAILKEDNGSEHKTYLKLYRHIQESDDVIGECFNDWRRSTLIMRLAAIQKHGLLLPDHLKQLTEKTQETLKALKDIYKEK